MKSEITKMAAAAALALGATQAYAATSIGEFTTVSGFGTTAVAVTDSDEAEFVRYGQLSGADDRPEFKVDSNLGLQLDMRPRNWVSATVQLLTQQRNGRNLDTSVEWAFVGVEPIDGLRARVGRTAMPVFAISDTRNVGFANNWVRPPNEVYGLALMENLDGADVSWYLPVGDASLTFTALYGESEVTVFATDVEMKNVHGAAVQWDSEWVSIRVAKILADSQLDDLGIPGVSGEDRYEFNDIGVHVDRGNVVARAEYVTRSSDTFDDLVDADGWYLYGGYRFGNVLPYAMYAVTEPDAGVQPGQLSSDQSTIAAGVRWDAFSAATLKFQVDYVDTDDTRGISFLTDTFSPPGSGLTVALPVEEPVTVVSVAVDYVF